MKLFPFGLMAGMLCAACAASPLPPSTAAPLAREATRPAQGEAARVIEVTTTPPPITKESTSRVALIVDEESNPDLYLALTEAAERTQALKNYCAAFVLRQLTRAQDQEQSEEVATASIDAETCAYPSGDKLIRVAEARAYGNKLSSYVSRELFRRVAGDTYLKLTESGGAEGTCIELVDKAMHEIVEEQLLTAEVLADLMLADVVSFTLAARAVQFEHFLVDQYTFNNTLSVQENERTLSIGTRGQIWFAPDLGTAVRHQGLFSGRLQITQDTSLDGEFSWEYRLRPTGFGTLELPEECNLSRSKEIPVFADALLVLRSKQSLEFLTRADANAVMTFYAESLPLKGWEKEYVERNTTSVTSEKYVRGDESLFIYYYEEGEIEKMLSVRILLN